MELKLESLRHPRDMDYIEDILETRLSETQLFRVSLEKIDDINLSTFNALIKLYMRIKRLGKSISYVNCHSEKLQALITKTKLNNVFCTK